MIPSSFYKSLMVVLPITVFVTSCARLGTGGFNDRSTVPNSEFNADLAYAQVLVIGETHGTIEIPKFVADLSKQLRGRTLFAFELPPDPISLDCVKLVLPPSWRRINDGRTSPAMLHAICAVQRNKLAKRSDVIFIDSRPTGIPTFYGGASRQIFERISSGEFDRVVVLVGNYHSRNAEPALASQLRKSGLRVVTATASSPNPGEAWQCQGEGLGDCKINKIELNFCPDEKSDKTLWTGRVPNGFRWDRCLLFPRLSASVSATQSHP